VAFLKEELLFTERRACRVAEIDRKTLYYESVRRDSSDLVERIKSIATRHLSYGSERVWGELRREGVEVGERRVRRIYRELGLTLPRKKKSLREKFKKERPSPRANIRPNQLWSMDFMFDKTQSGEKVMILTIIDQCSRYCPGLFVRRGFRQRDLIQALEAAIYNLEKPLGILSDNGIEFTQPIFRQWAKAQGISLYYTRPGRPTENAFIESFNGKIRVECLRKEEFLDLDDVAKKLEVWRSYYNTERQHSSLEKLTPSEFLKKFNNYNI
jgi:putative transposase